MSVEFKKFLIKKSSIWASGSFDIFDSDDRLVYKVRSSVWQLKKKMHFFDAKDSIVYTIEQRSSWPQKFIILDGKSEVASFEKRNPFQGKQIDVYCRDLDNFFIEGNVWGSNFSFKNEHEEIALLSYDMWSMGQFGIAMKDIYPEELILAVVISLAYMKISGQI